MSAATHTPGPWRHDRGDILTTDGRCIATVFSGAAASMEEDDANQRLIAAAPELLRCAVMALDELQKAERLHRLAGIDLRPLEAAIKAATPPP